MDSKGIKNALKSAREAISKKEYEVALEHCQNILEHDNKNYNALVFTGVAAEKLDKNEQALKAYKTATESNPEQVLAWQGLCSFYEKNQVYVSVYKPVLVTVYEKLIQLYEGDEKKKVEILKRLGGLLKDIGQIEKCIIVYKELLGLIQDKDEIFNIQKSLLPILESQTNTDSDYLINCYEDCLKSQHLSDEEKEAMLKKFSTLLLKVKSREVFKDEIKRLSTSYPSSPGIQEYIIIQLLEDMIGGEELMKKVNLNERLIEFKQIIADDSGILKLLQGYCLLVEKQYDQAKLLLLQGISQCSMVAIGYYVLAIVLYQLRDNHNSLKYINDCYQLISNNKKIICIMKKDIIKDKLDLLKCHVLYNIGTPNSLDQALQILQKYKDQDQYKLLLCKIYLKQNHGDQMKEIIKTVTGYENIKEYYFSWDDYNNKQYDQALSRLEKLCNKSEDHDNLSNIWCLMGKVIWTILQDKLQDTELQQKCYTTFLKAAQFDPQNGEPFLYLGHYYVNIRKDNRLGRKCYEKSYHLDKSLDESGAAICDMMINDGDEEGAYGLLVKVTNEANTGSAKWAWLRLGLCEIKLDNPIGAISSFQSALRSDPTDSHVWECLGEAYFNRGSYTAALKAFTKASELAEESFYCLYQIATIRQILGMYVEAIEEYKLILQKSPDYVPALKGIGETYLLLGKDHIKENLDGRVKDNCQQALKYLTQAASERSDMSCLWKLLGDVCLLVQPLSKDTCISVPVKLLEKCDDKTEEYREVDKLTVLDIASRCYGKALKILPESSMLWHDLGVSLYYQLPLTTSDSKPTSEKCLQCLRKAVSLDSNYYLHWNALGVISASKYIMKLDLAQHSFIKSIHCEANNVVAWTNLGTLYLQNDNVQLSHEAFKIAQSLDPNYVACWIGQAMIAETVGHEDTMDLYRHTTELSYHPEGSIGYAHWVCTVLQDTKKHHTDLYQYCIKQMAAIPSAADTLTRYLEREKDDITALNMYGLLLEQQKLYRSSLTALTRCVELLEIEGDQVKLNQAKINQARVLCKVGEYEKSVKIFSTITTDQLEDICCYGYSLYKSGNLGLSFKVYESALEKATNDEDKSHIYTVLGMIAYQQDDIATAKTYLFKSSQVTPPSVLGLKALCGLGLLQSDITLVGAVLQELVKHDNTSDAIWLTLAQHLVQGQINDGIRILQRSLHTDPLNSTNWLILAKILVQYYPQYSQTSLNSLKIAELYSDTKPGKVVENNGILVLAQLQSGHHSQTIVENNALRNSQILLLQNPGCIKNWLIFLCALHAEGSVRLCTENDKRLLNIELQYLNHLLQNNEEVKNIMNYKLWCNKQKLICLLVLGNIENSKQLLLQMVEDYKNCDLSQLLKDLIVDNKTPSIADYKENTYLTKVIIQSYIRNGLLKEAVDLIQKYLSTIADDSIGERKRQLLQISHLSYQLLIKKETEIEDVKKIFDKSITELLKLEPNNSVGLFMKGAVLLITDSTDEKRTKLIAKKIFLQSYRNSEDDSLTFCTEKARQQLIPLLQFLKIDEQLLENLIQEQNKSEDVN
ncbi:hypothetical protein LOTGIDRAFT_230642 [Lottia gigantea]|uniref:Tetratricopeptide repeat protein 37 n=1 Tax=Lottia gigantea TaxID=225164 RepID=V4ABA6_LOTGI|nr:hypothetical protein LOTGIDRAFT_230642 [Lottia gigantea]ESP01284.1 hypothetical protein LOTGIDRAFT_230642 [Lottia gigantea]